jgi:hypothetical protein
MSVRNLEEPDPVQRAMRAQNSRRRFIVGALLFCAFTALYWAYLADTPHDYGDSRDHFKYGSIGSDSSAGVPYWIWWVLPDMFPQYLPDGEAYKALPQDQRTPRAAYAQFGFVQEDDHDLPIGFTTRRITVDRIGLNCAVCHVSTVRVTEGMEPERIYGYAPSYSSAKKDRVIILGMPAATMDLGAYLTFLIKCAADKDFTQANVLAAIDRRHDLGPAERFFYKQAVPEVKKVLALQDKDFPFLHDNPPAGPGRVDTFNPYKNHVFKFPFDHSIGTSDYPSIWNQRPREGLQLHWDGNNTSVFERNISASLGAGATPVTLDMPRMLRVAEWIGSPDPHKIWTDEDARQARTDPRPRPGELPIPRFPFTIDTSLAKLGSAVFYRQPSEGSGRSCADCHDWQGKYIGQVIPIDKIGTDRYRLDSYTNELCANQNTLGADTWWRFNHFRKTHGYVNMPLDGLWARAPYLHNGSVPTLEALLTAPAQRSKSPFYRGDDVYDPAKVGFRSDQPRSADGRKLFEYHIDQKGNDNAGHNYGTDLSQDDKKALMEYLKTL